MPISKYDKYFGGKGGASKARRAMRNQYGDKKGEEVFYATKNKKKSTHVKDAIKKKLRPPDLRRGSSNRNCGNCTYYKSGRCSKYNGYKVSSGQVCNSWKGA